jgi:hypothetical protein
MLTPSMTGYWHSTAEQPACEIEDYSNRHWLDLANITFTPMTPP